MLFRSTEITARLRDEVSRRGHRAVMTDLRGVLPRHQAFCEISRGRWQLGKENANLGGLALPAGPSVPAPVRSAPASLSQWFTDGHA